jgi:signal transduction histidine kinase
MATELWILGGKFTLLVCVVVDLVVGHTGALTAALLLLLAYASTATLPHLSRRRPFRLIAQSLSLVVAAAGAAYVESAFLLLVPLASAELMYELSGNLVWTPVPAAACAFLAPQDRLPGYLLSAILGVLFFVLAARSGQRLETLRRENERLRVSVESGRDEAVRREAYEERLTQLAQLEERSRLTAEVHDKVGHAISGSLIQVEAAAAVLDNDTAQARTLLNNGARALREGMEDIRATLRAARPPVQTVGVAAIRSLLDRFALGGAIAAHLAHDGDLSFIRPAHWRILEDNLRECLTNTHRHARARSLSVRIQVLNRIIRMEVRDDGQGQQTVRKGLGIAGMEERTERVGGKLIVDGSRGFSVVTILPIELEV